jgi:aminoglycoside 3-N-acetyltransferase I
MNVIVRRLTAADRELARQVFAVLSRVFAEPQRPLSGAYLDRLLARTDFWAMAAFVDGRVVGGLTAHALPLTREEGAELFIYDVAVDPAVQRRGVGRALVDALRRDAATLSITVAFVPADDDDRHALDFYRALGGVPAAVTIFTFGGALRT